MPMPYAIINRVEYLATQERSSDGSGAQRLCNYNHERFPYGTEVDDEETLI